METSVSGDKSEDLSPLLTSEEQEELGIVNL